MKTFTNHTSGPRGINLTDKTTRWIEPGQSVDLDPKTISGDVPDLGKAPEAVADDAATIEALTAERDALKAQVDAQAKEITDLKATAAKK